MAYLSIVSFADESMEVLKPTITQFFEMEANLASSSLTLPTPPLKKVKTTSSS